MIRTIPIPKTVSRMGCAPGAGCCDECGGHSPAAPVNPAALMLGDVQCDSDGNCYTDGVLTAAPLTTGAGCAPGVASCSSSPATGISSTWLYIGMALAAVLLMEATSRRR